MNTLVIKRTFTTRTSSSARCTDAPSVSTFSTDGLTIKIPQAGHLVNFTCLAEGNPESLLKKTSKGIKALWSGLLQLSKAYELTCTETATYICQASHSMGLSAASSIDTNVLYVSAPSPASSSSPTPIIVGVVVPVAVIIIVVILVVVICCRRSRPRNAEVTQPDNPPPQMYDNIGPVGSNLSESYNVLNVDIPGTFNEYTAFNGANISAGRAGDSTKLYENVHFPAAASSLSSSQERQGQAGSETPTTQIIPVEPDVSRHGDNREESSGTAQNEAPILPGKIRSETKPASPSTKDVNPYKISPEREVRQEQTGSEAPAAHFILIEPDVSRHDGNKEASSAAARNEAPILTRKTISETRPSSSTKYENIYQIPPVRDQIKGVIVDISRPSSISTKPHSSNASQETKPVVKVEERIQSPFIPTKSYYKYVNLRQKPSVKMEEGTLSSHIATQLYNQYVSLQLEPVVEEEES